MRHLSSGGVRRYILATTGRERQGLGVEEGLRPARRGLQVALQPHSLWRVPTVAVLTAAVPMESPYCSCELTRGGGLQSLEAAFTAVNTEPAGGPDARIARALAARAKFLYGLALVAPGPLQDSGQGTRRVLEAVEQDGYAPEGFLELFFVVQALSAKLVSFEQAGRAATADAAAAAGAVVKYSEALIAAEPDASHESNVNTKQAVMVALCDRYLRQSGQAKGPAAAIALAGKAAAMCEAAIAINPAKEMQFLLLAR